MNNTETDEEELNESLLEIDQYRLDREWLLQPKRVMKYATMLADAKKEMLEHKAALDLAEAELELSIRKDPDDFGLEKITEAIVKAAVIVQPRYQKALKRYNNSRHRVDVLSALLEALQHRKKALEDLVTLHGQNYFSEPRAKVEERSSLEEQTKKAVRNKGVKKKEE